MSWDDQHEKILLDDEDWQDFHKTYTKRTMIIDRN
jgi:hypothetical protein